jgi:hypothetical protein
MDRNDKSTSAGMTRQSFLKAAALLPVAALSSSRTARCETLRVAPQVVSVTNEHFRLNIKAGQGLQVELIDANSGLKLADEEYSYSFGQPAFLPASIDRDGTANILSLVGSTANGLEIRQQYRIPHGDPWMEEEITLTNLGDHPVALPDARCGFVLPVNMAGGSVESPLKDFKFSAVPYRREPTGNRAQYADYTLTQVLTEHRHSELRAQSKTERWDRVYLAGNYSTGLIQTDYSQYASEGWVWTDGRQGFLITKYSQQGMEWALLDPVPLGREQLGLRWGGFGIFQGDPEGGAVLGAGAEQRFGVTRLTAYKGAIRDGFYTYRAELESRGMGCPTDFNPPVHWNELYDNKLWWVPDGGQDDPANRAKYYTINDLKEAAGKAKDIGCEALYLDPGWDTLFASKIWDEPRLGRLSDFTAMLRQDYGLRLSLHTPLSGWCDPSSYPSEIFRLNRDGQRIDNSLCGASQQYVDETLNRLLALAEGGATFFMFDGTMFNGACYDPNHDHPVPSRREDHVEATNRIAFLVHEKFPEVLIEMHDQILGGTSLRYVPTYYGYGQREASNGGVATHGFDTVWGFELMWSPMKDLVGGHSMALYYYNLAYSLPLYLHIDLRTDNAQCLMFWWNASTCRHLGIGGTHPDPAVRSAQKQAMSDYRRLEKFFKRGTFYGLDEMVHVHTHASERGAVMNVFNLEGKPAQRKIEFAPAEIGLSAARDFTAKGGDLTLRDGVYALDVSIPALGHTLVELQ